MAAGKTPTRRPSTRNTTPSPRVGKAKSAPRAPKLKVGKPAAPARPVAPRKSAVAAREVGTMASLPVALKVGGGIGILAIVVLIVLLVLSVTPAFTITAIDADATDHISSETIARLAKVEDGTTLLTVDEGAISAKIKKNPWVASVAVERELPDHLRIVVTERKVQAIVLMGSGSTAWYMGTGGVWIEPLNLMTQEGQSAADLALARARELNCLLIADVPSSVSPQAASVTTDDCIQAVLSYQDGFSEDFSSQVVSYSAASTEAVSCVLSSGVQISLGSASNISTKESVINEILSTYPDQITYINVRVPSKPTYRKVGTDQVQAGSGVSAQTEVEPSEQASTEEQASGDTQNTDFTEAPATESNEGDAENQQVNDGGNAEAGQ